MKKYLIFAASALALASCSSDDFLGENPGNVQNATTAINFGGDAGKITRATKNEGTPAEMLYGQFKVFGVKKLNDTKFQNVFTNYYVWNDTKSTTSNTKGWEYVGEKGTANLGTGKITLPSTHDQTIKYWDYSASEYHFVAGSLIDNFKPDPLIVSKDITYATISGLAGHINPNAADGTEEALVTNPVYVAEPVIVEKKDYQKPVQFNFIRQQSMVRVGLYETIPGYSITDIKFYAYDTDGTTLKVSTGNNVILTSATADYFVGGSDITGTVTYDWTSAAKPSYTYTYNTGLTKSQNWYAGKLSTLATTSSESKVDILYGTDKDMSDKGYFTVLPTPSATPANAIVIKCDYTLNADDHSGEVINVKGATAAIPAAFSKWEANTRYTYLFKISDNTNGTTGTTGDHAGLYPITFAAAVTASTDAQYGTTTTVTTPSITTYQEGSVVDKTIEYKTGKPIYATVTDETTGTLKDLNTDGTDGNVQVYKLSKERTEAELQIKAIIDTEITTTRKFDTTVPANDLTVGIGKLDAKKYLTFTPDVAGRYAIQYKYADGAYKYKVIEVK